MNNFQDSGYVNFKWMWPKGKIHFDNLKCLTQLITFFLYEIPWGIWVAERPIERKVGNKVKIREKRTWALLPTQRGNLGPYLLSLRQFQDCTQTKTVCLGFPYLGFMLSPKHCNAVPFVDATITCCVRPKRARRTDAKTILQKCSFKLKKFNERLF